MNHKYIFVFIGLIILIVGFFSINSFLKEPPREITPSYSEPFTFRVATEGDYKNFEKIISQNPMIQELPNNSKVLLNFYNYYSNEREWEKNYVLTKGKVSEGTATEYDIKLIMHSKYLTVLNSNNFCSVVKTARINGDFGTETATSPASLLWKFKGMMEYKDCLGF